MTKGQESEWNLMTGKGRVWGGICRICQRNEISKAPRNLYRITLAETLSSGDMEPERLTFCSRQDTQWRDKDPLTKLLTQNLSCLQEVQG